MPRASGGSCHLGPLVNFLPSPRRGSIADHFVLLELPAMLARFAVIVAAVFAVASLSPAFASDAKKDEKSMEKKDSKKKSSKKDEKKDEVKK